MKFINEDAIVKIGEGLTTPEEVLRVIFLEEEFQFRCPSCTRSIDPDFAICPFCRFELKIMCPACGIELNPEWTHCPHCRASLNSAPAPLQPPEPAAEAPTIEISDVDEPPVVVGAPPSPAVSQQPAPAEAATPKQTGPAPAQTSVVENPGGPIGQLPGQLTDILVPDGRFRVLIIDDDIVTCNLITLLMRRFEFQTTAVIANDGQQAFQKIEEEVPHLIVLDLLMPEMDGYEFLAKLRKELKTAFIPVIVITQTRQEETQKLAKQHGADAYLNKPLDPQDLEKCMKGLLSRIYGI